MRDIDQWLQGKPVEHQVPAPKDFVQIANDLCEKALKDAKEQLHPLLRNAQLDRLNERPEFVKSFKRAWNGELRENLPPGIRASRRSSSSMKRAWKPWNPGMVPFTCSSRCLVCQTR